jgi:hypothetical protein
VVYVTVLMFEEQAARSGRRDCSTKMYWHRSSCLL